MRFNRNTPLWASPSRDDERRRHGRLRTDAVTCSMGAVRDMSASGMRVEYRGRYAPVIDEAATLTIKCGHFALPVDVTVVRVEKLGFRRYMIGLRFEEMHPDIRRKLTHLASIAADQLVIAGRD